MTNVPPELSFVSVSAIFQFPWEIAQNIALHYTQTVAVAELAKIGRYSTQFWRVGKPPNPIPLDPPLQ